MQNTWDRSCFNTFSMLAHLDDQISWNFQPPFCTIIENKLTTVEKIQQMSIVVKCFSAVFFPETFWNKMSDQKFQYFLLFKKTLKVTQCLTSIKKTVM